MPNDMETTFEPAWEDPADASLAWILDPNHLPRPMPPLTQDVIRRVYMASLDERARVRFVNGYAFMANYAPPPLPPEAATWSAPSLWQDDYLPRVQAAHARLHERSYEGLSLSELTTGLGRLMDEVYAPFSLTLAMFFSFQGPTMALIDFCEEELGEEGLSVAAALLQGFENETAASGARLAALAETAAQSPAIAAALREGRLAALEALPGGREFLDRFAAFMEQYGRQVESWGLVHLPTWEERPEAALELLSRYVESRGRLSGRQEGSPAERRMEAKQTIASRLSGERLLRFEALLAAADDHVPISEGRAHWQLLLLGELRRGVLALGQKLVDDGLLAAANDVFFLSLEELEALGDGPAADLRPLVAQRTAQLKHWESLTPPPFIGTPLDVDKLPLPLRQARRRFSGLGSLPTNEAGLIRGHAASKGVGRGTARVIRSLNEADRLQPGDILVCPMTAPPWTPLLAVVGGVVTDGGGVLSHSAICAREYGIPCVVGTRVATAQIPDGATVRVDGDEGVVYIES